MRTDIENFSKRPSASVKDVMATIDRSALGICLVVDHEGKLLGTITDGDIRRALLAGYDLSSQAKAVMNSNPSTTESPLSDAELEELFTSRGVRSVPVIDSHGGVQGMQTLREHMQAHIRTSVPAVIMAGGLGSRLGNLTKSTPKPLLEVGGKPILEHIIEHLAAQGVTEIFITTRYLANQIEDHFGDGRKWSLKIDYVRERIRLGTAGALGHLKGKLTTPFLVMNGDLLTDVNVRRLSDFHREHSAAMTVAVRHYSMEVPFGVVESDGVEITGLSEKPTYDFFVNAGVYMLEPGLLKYISGNEMLDITQLIETAIADGERVVSFPIYEQWMDVGRPEDLNQARQKLQG